MGRVVAGFNASPRWTDNQGISLEGLNGKKIAVDELKAVEALLVDLHVMLQHLDLLWIDIVDNVLLKAIAEMNGDASNATERLEDPLHLLLLKPLPEVNRNGLRDDRVPALLINLNALLKPREQIVPFIEIPIQLLPNLITFLQFLCAVIVLSKFEIFLMDLEVGTDLETMVIFTQDLMGWEMIDTDLRQLHERRSLGESIFNYYKKWDNDFL